MQPLFKDLYRNSSRKSTPKRIRLGIQEPQSEQKSALSRSDALERRAAHTLSRYPVATMQHMFPGYHASVIACRMASTPEDAPDFRMTIGPPRVNGLRANSRIMAESS